MSLTSTSVWLSSLSLHWPLLTFKPPLSFPFPRYPPSHGRFMRGDESGKRFELDFRDVAVYLAATSSWKIIGALLRNMRQQLLRWCVLNPMRTARGTAGGHPQFTEIGMTQKWWSCWQCMLRRKLFCCMNGRVREPISSKCQKQGV